MNDLGSGAARSAIRSVFFDVDFTLRLRAVLLCRSGETPPGVPDGIRVIRTLAELLRLV